jgi:hypothetical protein
MVSLRTRGGIMVIMRMFCTAAVLMIVSASAIGSSVAARSPQRLAMMRAEWRDKETWTHYNETQRENELGLGLHVPGPTGQTYVAFTGVLRVRAATTPPTEIGVQVAIGKFANPTVIRRPVLLLVADPDGTRPFRLDLTERLEVDDPTPGGATENAVGMMTAAEFVRLVEAKKLLGDVLGFEAMFREDQLTAMRQFATRLYLKVTQPAP